MPRNRWRRLMAPALVMSLVVSGIAGQGVASARPTEDRTPATVATTPTVGTTADGAALMRGVFFLQGEVGQKLERLPYVFMDAENLRKNRSAEAVQAVTRLIEEAEADRPGLLASFSTGMRSGDPYQVETALTEAGSALEAALGDRPILFSDEDEEDTNLAANVETTVAVVNVGTAAVALAVIVAIAAIFVLVAFLDSRERPLGGRDLETERLMALFATELRTI
ncbi:antimicrobial peptide, SdpC family [Micromonospora sediminimaris]|nr:antimicrobial peptide, SdpC family [Micromonospora sediminimaris]